ncbi:hypothetical protein ABPG74_013084 [Tetrahymena malaccensis]
MKMKASQYDVNNYIELFQKNNKFHINFYVLFTKETLESKRGYDFFEFIDKIKQMLPAIQYQPNMNGLVITKVHQQNKQDFNSYIQKPSNPLKSLGGKINLRKFKFIQAQLKSPVL